VASLLLLPLLIPIPAAVFFCVRPITVPIRISGTVYGIECGVADALVGCLLLALALTLGASAIAAARAAPIARAVAAALFLVPLPRPCPVLGLGLCSHQANTLSTRTRGRAAIHGI
jgi:hypothetical protein